jgi:hypothetical protein
VFVNCSLLKNDAAGGDFNQIAHRHHEGVDLESLFFRDLLDILADPWRLDYVGKSPAGNQQVFKPRIGRPIPGRRIALSGQGRVKTQFGEIADEKACSCAPGPGYDEMSLRVLSGMGLRYGALSPLSADSIMNSGHAYAPGGNGFNRSLAAPMFNG